MHAANPAGERESWSVRRRPASFYLVPTRKECPIGENHGSICIFSVSGFRSIDSEKTKPKNLPGVYTELNAALLIRLNRANFFAASVIIVYR